MATATSSRLRVAIVAVLALASTAIVAACGSSARPAASRSHAFAWLHPSTPPRSWRASDLPGRAARIAYPGDWRPIRSDAGTVSAALRSRTGDIIGYLNATPRQGAEALDNWSRFRVDHNGDEGDVDVRPLAAATGLRFNRAHGSCVIDDYTSSTGQDYREIACIVAGESATTVVVGAAPPARWRTQGPAIERAISSFVT
jgi:hypothetical protein